MNKVLLTGRLTKEPTKRSTEEGKSVTEISVAVQRNGKPEEADFINCVAWGTTADNCGKYLVKGQKVEIEGNLHVSKYQDRTGKTQYKTEVYIDRIQFLEKPKTAQAQEIDEDDLPF